MTQRNDIKVEHFRQVLLWPLRLMPVKTAGRVPSTPWELLSEQGEASPWVEVVDEYTGAAGSFQERHYNEFVAFLPFVQRFLYGDGRVNRGKLGRRLESPMRVFRRKDVATTRVVNRPGEEPLNLNVVHIDLYFFLNIDLVLLNVELSAEHISLHQAQELLHRLGRGYPSGWNENGRALLCAESVEFLDRHGGVLARSDMQDREAYLEHVSAHRAPKISNHWDFLLRPLVSDHSASPGSLRYRQIEYYRMPLMAYLAVDEPLALQRSDFVRLGLVTGAGEQGVTSTAALPYADHHLDDFDRKYCYDRFWCDSGPAPNTRYLCNGHSLIVVGSARSSFFRCHLRGVLAQFRHQHFLIFVIAHFQKAALLMFSDRLAEALRPLVISDPESVRRFKRTIRSSFEGFLGFTHLYWFREVAEQTQTRDLFRMCADHLGIEPLYREVKERTADMNGYLDADALRRQANTVVRLTVVTIFGLIGTVSAGILGMNLLEESDSSLARRLAIFAVVLFVTSFITIYTMVKSKRLSDFLDAVSDERLSVWQKVMSFVAVWRR
jgi:hypothetical protein